MPKLLIRGKIPTCTDAHEVHRIASEFRPCSDARLRDNRAGTGFLETATGQHGMTLISHVTVLLRAIMGRAYAARFRLKRIHRCVSIKWSYYFR